ncbi:MAG: alpha/beta hydrolase, partial [Psychrobacter sp.]|nr:alpha/beta hydrolase [Psychrobacter sp.]
AEEKRLSITEKMLSYSPMINYQSHTLHYAMKGLGCLPTPVLESLVSYLKGPSSKQYLHADAHLRLILAVNSNLKTPLELTPMHELRDRFAADAVAMQSPRVWQQASINTLSSLMRCAKKGDTPISWEDKTIANADDGDMTVRCYQASKRSYGINTKKCAIHNPDETVMLFFHGGGFCIGDVDTHHEFCHAVCEQAGWPVVSVDYRLAPEYPAPTALQDCITAYAWLAENCQSLGATPSRIVLAGDSAGGGLSTLMAQQLAAPTEDAWLDLSMDGQDMFELLKSLPSPLAQMPLYPVTDIETDYPSWELYGEGLLLDHADVAVFDAACFDHSPLPRQHILNCPMLGDNSKVCPTYIVAAELDVLRDEAFAYTKQLKAHDVPVETYTVLGAPHGFIHFMSIHQGIGQETGDIIKGFASFVRDVINTQSQLAA